MSSLGYKKAITTPHVMSDFYQNGIISTLHNLRTQSLDDLEKNIKVIGIDSINDYYSK